MMPTIAIRTLANEGRLQILDWLKNPTKHFPPLVDGDLVAIATENDGIIGLMWSQGQTLRLSKNQDRSIFPSGS
jgi:hypothetical protein